MDVWSWELWECRCTTAVWLITASRHRCGGCWKLHKGSFNSLLNLSVDELKWTESIYLPLLICRGEWRRWSDGSGLSGERDRLARPWDRLEWSDVREWISEMSENQIMRPYTVRTIKQECWNSKQWNYSRVCLTMWGDVPVVSPSLSELLADGMLSSRSGMLSNVARSSLCTTIFSLPFDLSISFLASISDKFSVTVPLICRRR